MLHKCYICPGDKFASQATYAMALPQSGHASIIIKVHANTGWTNTLYLHTPSLMPREVQSNVSSSWESRHTGLQWTCWNLARFIARLRRFISVRRWDERMSNTKKLILHLYAHCMLQVYAPRSYMYGIYVCVCVCRKTFSGNRDTELNSYTHLHRVVSVPAKVVIGLTRVSALRDQAYNCYGGDR